MGFSPDVLVAALQKLEKDGPTTFDLYHPAFNAIVERQSRRVLGQPYLEFGLVPTGPGTINTLDGGIEVIEGGLNQDSVRGSAYSSRMIYAYDVPGKDLADASSEADLVGLIRKYPQRAKLDFMENLSKQLMMGNVARLPGFITLNGDATYNPGALGARSGVFEFESKATQSNSVFGVAANSILNWHTQYRHITGMGLDGDKQIRGAFYDAEEQGSDSDGVVDVISADRGTFDNIVQEFKSLIFVPSQTITGDPGLNQSQFRRGLPFFADGRARIYSEQHIVPSEFSTANAQLGVMYGLNSRTWNLYTKGDGEMTTNGWFAYRKPIRHVTQELWRYEIVLDLAMYCDDLRRNFSVTGGAVE